MSEVPIDTQTVDLKTCPFCGNVAFIVWNTFHGLPSTYSVSCRGCKCSTWTFYESKDEAATAWNRRAGNAR